MPLYTFKRADGETVTKRLSFSDYEACKAGALAVTDKDGGPLELMFDPGRPAFVMKDGASGGWMTKVGKEAKYRAARNQEMSRREKDHVFKSSLIPNYGGNEAHSWSDVRDHVRSVKGEASASTYDSLVGKERR